MSKTIAIAGRKIGPDTDAYIIAEIGHNHGGSVERCKALIKAAKDCGVDAVKLQKRDNRTLYTPAMYDAPYSGPHSFGATYGEHREALEFSHDEFIEIADFCENLGITMFATPFDSASADMLHQMGMPAYKIASGDLTNIPLIRQVASYGEPVILSTGGAKWADLYRAATASYDEGMDRLAMLHCVAGYPVEPQHVNLSAIPHMIGRFGSAAVIGWSDHYNGICMAEAAFIMGARIIEKHFTLNHTWKGTDHALSLEPEGMRRMVRDIRRLRLAMGDGDKRLLDIEEGPLRKMAKSIYAAREIREGEVIGAADITVRSPGLDGLPPYKAAKLAGSPAKRDFNAWDLMST